MEALKSAWEAGESFTNAPEFVPKTVQEIRTLCALKPQNPTAIDLMKGIEGFPEDKVCYLLPASIQAVQENRSVRLIWEMKKIVSPIDGSVSWKKTRSILLGDLIEGEQKEEEKETEK